MRLRIRARVGVGAGARLVYLAVFFLTSVFDVENVQVIAYESTIVASAYECSLLRIAVGHSSVVVNFIETFLYCWQLRATLSSTKVL